LAARSFFARLHYTGPATTLGALLVCGAVTVNEGSSQAGLKAIIVAALLVSTGPLIVHATARAARIRDLGEWRLLDEEKARVEEP
jgi:multisubunit Na+/H+ antiporter MnhG subunit